MKKAISVLLMAALLLSLTACGGGAKTLEAARPAPEETRTAPAAELPAEPETEPTLSPEALLIESLPEKVREAYELGLVEPETLEDLDRICLGREAAQMVQRVHVLRHGKESKIMNQLLETDHADLEVCRYWLAQTMFAAEAERLREAPSGDYFENLAYMLGIEDSEFRNYFLCSGGSAVHQNNPECWFYRFEDPDAIVRSEIDFSPDRAETYYDPALDIGQELYVNCAVDSSLPRWVMLGFDRTTGEKIMAGGENVPFLPREKMTVREVAETVLRYCNWIPPEPEMLSYGDVPAYDKAIIPDELLNKETTLPEASCQHLPEQWHGITLDTLCAGAGAQADLMIQENEIQVLKDAGFNFVRVLLDMRYYVSDAFALYDPNGWQDNKAAGRMNESRLKELDQVIAWCMERDIHVNLCVGNWLADWPDISEPALFGNPENAKPLAEQLQVLARRYAAIPNTYLSFTPYESPDFRRAADCDAFYPPVLEAIWEVSPERCIIIDVGERYDGAGAAALGAALSCQAQWPEAFLVDVSASQSQRNRLFETAVWPYEKGGASADAEAAMGSRIYGYVAPDTVAAVAREHGVGFMVGHWAPIRNSTAASHRTRYRDETMEAYLTDFGRVLADRGYGWNYGHGYGFVDLFSAYPAISAATYTQVGNAPLYIDDSMMAWFRTINGVD